MSMTLHGNPSPSYRASLAAVWDRKLLSATPHQWTCPTSTSARQASARFT